MLTPSKTMIELIECHPILRGNAHLLVADFQNCPSTSDVGSQDVLDYAFLCFIFGVTNIMNPESNFNKNYKPQEVKNEERDNDKQESP